MRKEIRDDILLKQIGNRMKELRRKKGVSQLRVLIDTEIQVSRIESAKYNLSISTISALCKYYGISLNDFFDDIESQDISDKTPKKK